jgi:Ca2+-transporting ATPase
VDLKAVPADLRRLARPQGAAPVAAPWAQTEAGILEALHVDPGRGLAAAEAARRARHYGHNRLRQLERREALAVLIDQFRSIVILLLIGAAGLSLAFGDVLESIAIVAVVVVNTALGFITELRAVRSMEALRQLARVDTTVRRDGAVQRVPAEALVPGDVVLIEGGDVITADLRVLAASKMEADESALTGESAPVGKKIGALAAGTHLPERANMLFKGTAVTRGSGEAVVAATGLATELGRISQLVAEAEAAETPLEKRLDALGQRLVWVTLGIAALVAGAGLAVGRDTVLAIEVAIALAVAAIPEGLPIVATIALARGMWRMARRRALIARLSAVETLGATSVILTDKTGTLTENRMTVIRLELEGATVEIGGAGLDTEGTMATASGPLDGRTAAVVDALLTAAALCNDATFTRGSAAAAGTADGSSGPGAVSACGDPTEVALLVAAAKRGIWREQQLASLPELREEAFDPDTRMMATFNGRPGNVRVSVKGAPEAVLEHCTRILASDGESDMDAAARSAWRRRADALATQGLRTLAIAAKDAQDAGTAPYEGLTLLGVAGLLDPPREGVADAIAACQSAGIRVVVVTGDHPATAACVATAIGLVRANGARRECLDARVHPDFTALTGDARRALLDAAVIARATPRQKLDLIAVHQQLDRVVAMTGDGVNDAPALKKADIGVAMGVRGTQVAKEAAAMVLQDDEFGTIVAAVAQGRTIYDNIRKFVIYLLSCNISEILVVALATFVGAPLPLLPLQILFLNLVTDVFPALALGVGEGGPGLMAQRPRPAHERLLTAAHWSLVAAYGALISASVLAAMYLGITQLGMTGARAVTVSFLTLAFAQLWHVFNMRDLPGRWLRNEVVANPWVWGAVALCVALVLLAVYVPALASILKLTPPDTTEWALILAMSLLPLVAGPALRAAIGRGNRRRSSPSRV